MTTPKTLTTRRGLIRLPAYFPVTTFGDRYPLDRLIRPYLPRLAPGVMVSAYYARQMDEPLRVPLLVDSGGFASLREGGRMVATGELGVLEVSRAGRTERFHPREVLELQEQIADVAFTLDFPIPPSMSRGEARDRRKRTQTNAHWALANRRRRDLPLFACVQGWDTASFRQGARTYARSGFDGIAVGGLVPRLRQTDEVMAILAAVRQEVGTLPLHVFGLGKPDLIERLFHLGVDSVDSSAYVKLAVNGRCWSDATFQLTEPSPFERLQLALCNLACATGKTLPLSVAPLVFGMRPLQVVVGTPAQ